MTRAWLPSTVSVCGLSLVLSACGYSERSYRGDGTLVDRGWYAGSDRYVLDLGVTDLTKAGRRLYTMANLPPERLAVGFQILAPSSSEELAQNRQLPFNPVVRLQMTSPSGVLISEERPLNEWVLSTVGSNSYPVFAYCRGLGDTWDEQAGTAWGCVFKPKAGERYTTTVQIVRPDSRAAGYRIRLLIQGGGELAS